MDMTKRYEVTIEMHTPFTGDTIIKSKDLFYAQTSVNGIGHGYGLQCNLTEDTHPDECDKIEDLCAKIVECMAEIEKLNKKEQ